MGRGVKRHSCDQDRVSLTCVGASVSVCKRVCVSVSLCKSTPSLSSSVNDRTQKSQIKDTSALHYFLVDVLYCKKKEKERRFR